MQMLKKLFNSENKYFLELDEIKESQPVQTVVKTAEKVADAVKEKTAEVAESQPVEEAVKSAKETKDKVQDKAKSAATKVKPDKTESASEANGKSSQTKKTAKSAEETKDKPVSVENSGASSYDPPFWVAAMYNNNSQASESSKAEQTFATDNLMPTVTKYRRRPGGSLKKFKEMARQAKTPKG